jgi:hypothetical protein
VSECGDLVLNYLDRRKISGRDLARRLNVAHGAIYWLIAGKDNKGRRYLGLRSSQAGKPVLLMRIARELDIPRGRLADALFEDLGYTKRSTRPGARGKEKR